MLLPTTDEGSVNATVVVDSELEYKVVSKYTDDLVEELRQISDEIETVSASFGDSSGILAMVAGSSSTDITSISLTVKLKADHKKDTSDYANEIEKVIKEFNVENKLVNYGMSTSNIIDYEVNASESAMTQLTSGGFSVKIKGYDLEKMEIVAKKLAEITASVEGMVDVSSGVQGSQNNLKIYVNKLNAAKVGLTQQDFVESVNLFLESDGLSLSTDTETVTLNFNGINYDISLPSNLSIEGFNLANLMELFGSYEEFLESFVVLDRATIAKIKESGKSLYSFIPLDAEGNDIMNVTDPDALKNIAGIRVSVDLGYHEATNTYFSYYEKKIEKLMYEQYLNNPMLPPSYAGMLQAQIDAVNELLNNGVSFESLAKGKLLGDENDPNHISLVKPVTGYTSISSDGNYRFFNVTGQIKKDYNVTNVSSKVEDKINEYLESEEFAP